MRKWALAPSRGRSTCRLRAVVGAGLLQLDSAAAAVTFCLWGNQDQHTQNRSGRNSAGLRGGASPPLTRQQQLLGPLGPCVHVTWSPTSSICGCAGRSRPIHGGSASAADVLMPGIQHTFRPPVAHSRFQFLEPETEGTTGQEHKVTMTTTGELGRTDTGTTVRFQWHGCRWMDG